MVTGAEFSGARIWRLEAEEFVSRDEFLTDFSGFVDKLVEAEEYLKMGGEGQDVIDWGNSLLENLNFTPQERELFGTTLNLFSIEHSLPPHFPETCEFLKGKGNQELSIEIGGPIAVSKSVLAKFLASQIGAERLEEEFQPGANPFCGLAYKNPDFLLRSQLNFLLAGIEAGLRAKYHRGRGVRDASTWSDIFVFMEQKFQRGLVSQEEHETYLRLIELLDPLINRPSLLLMLVANSPERLEEGFQARMAAEPETRRMEENITLRDLEVFNEAAQKAVKDLQGRGVNVLEIVVDPVEIYQRSELRHATVHYIREKLGILKEFLTRDPSEVAQEIMKIFASNQEPQVVIIHSKSMFTGKTSACNLVAESVGPEKVLAFQPLAAIRYGEEHLSSMIDRDGRKIPARTIESNRLPDIIEFIDKELIDEKKITPKDRPFILIDELMLFIESDWDEAIWTIEQLRSRGFSVVANGLTYTFQEEPFTFMHSLIAKTGSHPNWHQIEMGTRCKYCEKPARGTRRLKPDGSTTDFNDRTFLAGDNYEPVCCDEHKSCEDQPDNFQRQPLPK